MRNKNTYSRLIQSISGWGADHKNLEKGEMISLLHRCIEENITSFDCGDFSGNISDRTFGTALSESGLSRDNIELIAKYKNSATKKSLTATVENLLITLRTDQLDLLLLEFPEHLEELIEELGKLSSQGKILEIGGVNLQESEINSFSKIFPARANQMQIDFFSSEGLNPLSTMKTLSEEITQIVYFNSTSPSTGGERNKIYKELCSKYEIDTHQLLLSWILQHPSHLHPVIPFSEEDMITKSANTKDIQMDPADWQKINLLLT